MPRQTVSVIIPAYNASNTIDATIGSVRDQTWRELEILVVDDGSTDDTPDRVERHSAHDGRIRLIRQTNGGVARARNAGIGTAQGAYIAPLDADDIWAPEKIALQVAALEAASADTALAYNWFRRIDDAGRVIPPSPYPVVEGHVYHRHIVWNFISNGSTPLVRAETLRAIGYDPALRDAGHEGCEDYMMQLRAARDHRFVCVPAFLTGYRRTAGSMSATTARMFRSHIQMFAILEREASGEALRLMKRRRALLTVSLARHYLRRREPASALAALLSALAMAPASVIGAAFKRGNVKASAWDTPSPDARLFEAMNITTRDQDWATRLPQKLLDQLAVLDEQRQR